MQVAAPVNQIDPMALSLHVPARSAPVAGAWFKRNVRPQPCALSVSPVTVHAIIYTHVRQVCDVVAHSRQPRVLNPPPAGLKVVQNLSHAVHEQFPLLAVEVSIKLLLGPFTACVFVEFANVHEPCVAPDRAGGGTGYNIKMSRGVDGVVPF